MLHRLSLQSGFESNMHLFPLPLDYSIYIYTHTYSTSFRKSRHCYLLSFSYIFFKYPNQGIQFFQQFHVNNFDFSVMAIPKFPTVHKCASIGREKQTVVADMDGTLLIGRSSFPYFALFAYEIGGILRLLLLLLASPIAAILYYFVSESAGIQILIFTTFAGMKMSDIESVARAVLPKFYTADLHPESWRVFSSCGKRCVLTANPRIMVEAFLKDFLGADLVLGTEMVSYKGRATGFVCQPGVLVGSRKADALKKAFGDQEPDIGLGDRDTDVPFMSLCKVSLCFSVSVWLFHFFNC